jgi:uncharacterized protein YndB with AHSA1/START domain
MSFVYSYESTIPATPAAVFRALTDERELMKWFAQGAQVEPRPGGVYRFWGRHTPGTPPEDAARQVITRFEQDRLLAFDWPINEVDTDVVIQLAPAPEGTTLSLTHCVSGDLRLPRQQELIENHWRHAIANLVALLSGGGDVILPDYFATGTAE